MTGSRVGGAVRDSWRAAALLALAAAAVPLYRRVSQVSGAFLAHPQTLLWPLLGVTLVYVAACLVVSISIPTSHRVALVELGALLLAGVAFRAVVFGTPPLLSHDAYRYAWDPYLLAHGLSPYLHAPTDPLLASLRDGAIWPSLNWRNAPTIYPPGAQAFFFMVYLIKPLSIWAVKWAITSADAAVALLLLALLRRRGMDPRLVLLYWWSPIAVVEFAGNAHLDAVAVAWVLLALLLAQSRWRGARFAVGIALGMATLTKLYPLLFALAIGRRRDRSFYAGLLGTVATGYLPVLVSGSRSTGFLETYVGQRFPDQGILVVAISKMTGLLGGGDAVIVAAQAIAALTLCCVVVVWRVRREPPTEAVMLALTGLYFTLAPHTFPWYVAVALPLVALLWRTGFALKRSQEALPKLAVTPPSHRDGKGVGGLGHPSALVLAMWLFAAWIPFTYIIFAPGRPAALFDWLSLATALIPTLPWIVRCVRQESKQRPVGAPPLFVGHPGARFPGSPSPRGRGSRGKVRSQRESEARG